MRNHFTHPNTKAPNTDQSVPVGNAANAVLKQIRDRLEQEFPACVYVTEDEFVKLLGVNKKTLQNKRSEERGKKKKVYPVPTRLGDMRQLVYPRSVILDWFAKQEFICMARTIHRCH